MIVALLVTLSGTAFTGWLIEDEARVAKLPAMPAIVAPAWADDGDEREYGERGQVEGPLKEVHEALANLMLLLGYWNWHGSASGTRPDEASGGPAGAAQVRRVPWACWGKVCLLMPVDE